MAKAPRAAYVDTSYLVAIALGEPGSAKVAARLAGYESLSACTWSTSGGAGCGARTR